MAERLWSRRDLNFIFSTSLKVSNTTARSWREEGGGGGHKEEVSSVADQKDGPAKKFGYKTKLSLYQVHDEIQLYGEVNDKENTRPAVLGVCWHHHIREAAEDGKKGDNPVMWSRNMFKHKIWRQII